MTDVPRKLEFVLLCALLFVLPNFEAPKNICIALFVLVWTARRLFAWRFHLRRPDAIEVAAIGMLAAAYASTLVNWPLQNGFKGAMDTLKYVAVFWFIYRGGYSEHQHRILVYSATVGILAGLGLGVAEVMLGSRPRLEFHSAGIVTQSAIYLGTGLIVAVGFVIASLHATPSRRYLVARGFWLLALVIMALGIFFMGSRGATLAVLSVAGLLLLITKHRTLWISLVAVVALAGGVALLAPDVVKQREAFSKIADVLSGQFGPADAYRIDNWRIAARQITQGNTVILGVGPKNFHNIDRTRFDFDPPLRIPPDMGHAHAHNMFLTKLTEEGVVGFAALVSFFALVLVHLVRDWRRGNGRRDWRWTTGLGALLVPAIAGSFNSPFYGEHALFAMALLGIYLASRLPAATGGRQ